MKNSERFSRALQEHMDDINVYGKFILTEDLNGESEYFHISVSLVNEYMISADAHFFSHVTDNPNINNLIQEYFPNDSYSYEELSIFRGYHPYFFEFNARSNDRRLRSYIRELLGRWVPLQLVEDCGVSSNPFSINGTLILGASPIIHKGKRLEFNPYPATDSLMKYIEKVYSSAYLLRITRGCINKRLTLERFKKLLPTDIQHIKGTVYNVGQGNNIKLRLEDNASNACTILFDVGCTHIKNVLSKPNIQANLAHFAKERFDAIILSHWDTDHILAVEHYNEHLLYSKNMIWIAPNLNVLKWEEVRHSAFILACYVRYKSNLYLSDHFNDKLGISNKVFELWQGKNKPTGSNSSKNAIGLIIELKGEGYTSVNNIVPAHHLMKGKSSIAALLTGDCPYDNIPDPLKTDRTYDIIISPHHGSKHSTPDIAGTGDSSAIISCCSTKTITYPDANHALSLIRNGFPHVYVTELVSNIEFEMDF